MSVLRLLLLAAALTLLASPAAAAGQDFSLSAKDDEGRFRFVSGAENPTLVARSGDTVTLRLTNEGSTGHNWQLASGEAAIPFPLAPGASANVTFAAPPEGDHAYVCLAHEAQGMRGILRIEEAATPMAFGWVVAALAAASVLGTMRRRS